MTFMNPQPEPPIDSGLEPTLQVRRGRIQMLTIYEVEASELQILERGSSDSIFLNAGIALLSMAVTLSATLATAQFSTERQWTTFLVLTLLGYIVGVVMFLFWWKGRKSVGACVRSIRARLPMEELGGEGSSLEESLRV